MKKLTIVLGLITVLLTSVASFACYDMYSSSSFNDQQVSCSSQSCFMVHQAANIDDDA
ncbi:hypothetical protein OAO18_07040 [Francisellaceae bacterium]|nr:hypothetical protein [Francisellaceae bacterium]